MPRRYQLPSLNALRVFDVAATYLDIKQAAGILCVTPDAVRYQMKLLEQDLGKQLFLRTRGGLELTPDGRALHSICSSALQQIADGIDILKADSKDRHIKVATLPGFSAWILMPHQDEFNELHPNFKLDIHHTLTMPSFLENFDFFINFGRGPWPDLQSDLLFKTVLTPALAPKLMKSANIRTPADLQKVAILLQSRDFQELCVEWYGANGIAGWQSLRYIDCNDLHTALQMAVSGMGAMFPPRILVDDLIDVEQLVTPFEVSLTDHGYYLVYTSATLKKRHCRAFRDWIIHHCRSSGYS